MSAEAHGELKPGQADPRRPILLMRPGEAATEIEGFSVCSRRQFEFRQRWDGKAVLIQPNLSNGDPTYGLAGCHKFFSEKGLQIYWADSAGKVTQEIAPVPANMTERQQAQFALYPSAKGWIANNATRIQILRGDTWETLYTTENNIFVVRGDPISPDGCKLAFEILNSRPTKGGRVHWFHKEIRVIDFCAI